MSALGADGGGLTFLLDALRRFVSSLLVYKTSVIFILSRQCVNLSILFSIILAVGIRMRMMVK